MVLSLNFLEVDHTLTSHAKYTHYMLLLSSLLFFFIYTIFNFTTDLTLIFVLSCSASFLSFEIFTTGKLVVDLGRGVWDVEYC